MGCNGLTVNAVKGFETDALAIASFLPPPANAHDDGDDDGLGLR